MRLCHELAGARQGVLWPAGGVERRPVIVPERVSLLGAGDGLVGVRGIFAPGPDARQSGRDVGSEKQTMERDAVCLRHAAQRIAFLWTSEYGVDDYRVTCRDDTSCLFGERGV